MLRIVNCVPGTDFSAGSAAIQDKPNQNDEPDCAEQDECANDLISGEAHLLVDGSAGADCPVCAFESPDTFAGYVPVATC